MGRRRTTASRITRGSVVLVPFPFTDLSRSKRRPAVVVSPNGFHRDDLILCAITSQPRTVLGPWEVRLTSSDLLDALLPKPSVVQVGKLFTIHRSLIVGRFGRVSPSKLADVLSRLVRLVSP